MDKQIQITSNQLQAKYPQHQHSIKLIECLAKTESNDTDAKMEFLSMASQLMPEGKPTFKTIVSYPMIREMVVAEGRKNMLKALFLLVKSFCNSLNVVRNMNEDQMIEAAQMLIDECGNFRLEDYVMMFQLAKRGSLVKILDRMDIQVISQMLDAYWAKRHEEGTRIQEQDVQHIESLGNPAKFKDSLNPTDAKAVAAANRLLGSIESLRTKTADWIGDKEEMERLTEIEKRHSEEIRKLQNNQ